MLTEVKDTLPPGKQIQCGISYPLQLRPSLHQRDQTEAGDETEGTLGCLQEGEDGEISCSGACAPLNPLGGDHCTGPWQRTGVVGEGDPAHPDDTCGGALQPRWKTEVPGCWTAVMRRQGGRSNPH